nr:MAG TPA_asm: hypothetical protein [Caudoviricetes sp.]
MLILKVYINYTKSNIIEIIANKIIKSILILSFLFIITSL